MCDFNKERLLIFRRIAEILYVVPSLRYGVEKLEDASDETDDVCHEGGMQTRCYRDAQPERLCRRR